MAPTECSVGTVSSTVRRRMSVILCLGEELFASRESVGWLVG